MSLDGPLRQVEIAGVELKKAAGSNQAWADQQRRAFDAQRMKPLLDAGARLRAALQKAQEQCAKAERLLRDS